jgi:hypothetical protein
LGKEPELAVQSYSPSHKSHTVVLKQLVVVRRCHIFSFALILSVYKHMVRNVSVSC